MAPVHVGIPWLATSTFVASSPWGDASDDVTLVATGTQQYRWGSIHATSESGLCPTLPRDAALEAVSSGDRTTFGRYTACGLQARSHPQTDLMASRAVVYSAPQNRCGAGGLVHHHRSLFHRAAIRQRRDGNVRIVRHVGHPNHFWDRVLIRIRDRACW